MRMRLLLVVMLLVGASVPAFAQDVTSPEGIALRNQILQLQAQVNALQAGGSPPPPVATAPVNGSTAPAAGSGTGELSAELLTRVSNLEDQVRTLTGEVDQLTNDLKQQNQSFTKQISDINFQLQGGVSAAPAAPGAAPGADQNAPASPDQTSGLPAGTLGTLPAGQAIPPPAPAAAPSAEDTLQDGLTALGKRDFTAAEADAKAVLATDRATPLGYDAQFLLARALAGKRDWEGAAVAYDDTFKRARFGSHSQDAQLGEARALVALGDNGAACGALNRLGKQYPTPRADLAPAITKLHARVCG